MKIITTNNNKHPHSFNINTFSFFLSLFFFFFSLSILFTLILQTMKIFDIEEFDNINNATLDGSTSYFSSTSNQLVQTSGLKTTTTGSFSGFKSGINVTPMIKLRGISHLTEEERRERYRTRLTDKLIINPMIKLPGPASRKSYLTPLGSSSFADQGQQRITSEGSSACSKIDQTEQKVTFSTFGDPFIMQIRKDESSSTR